MKTVSDVLQSKGPGVWSVRPDDTVYDALSLMSEKDIGAVLVMEGDRLIGILSERDYARKVVLKGRWSRDTAVREIMTERVLFVRPENTLEECMAIMSAKHIRHLPVMIEDRVAGVVSISDVVRALLSEQAFMITQLENYITGRTR